MPLRAEVLVGVDAGAARGGEPLLGPAGLVLLRGGVLVGVSAGVGAGVGGHGAMYRKTKTRDLTGVFSPPDGFIGAG